MRLFHGSSVAGRFSVISVLPGFLYWLTEGCDAPLSPPLNCEAKGPRIRIGQYVTLYIGLSLRIGRLLISRVLSCRSWTLFFFRWYFDFFYVYVHMLTLKSVQLRFLWKIQKILVKQHLTFLLKWSFQLLIPRLSFIRMSLLIFAFIVFNVLCDTSVSSTSLF